MKVKKSERFVELRDVENDNTLFECIEITIDGEQVVLVATDMIDGYETIADLILETLKSEIENGNLTYYDVYGCIEE